MEYEAIEVVALGKSREVLAGLGSVVVVKLDDNGALLGIFSDRITLPSAETLTIVVSRATSVAIV